MKTVKEIEDEITETVRSINKESDRAEIKEAERYVVFLRQCKYYMESNPREEFIKTQMDEVKRRIDLIPTHYEAWTTGKVLGKYKDPYRTYCSEMGLSEMKAQIKTLNYLLS